MVKMIFFFFPEDMNCDMVTTRHGNDTSKLRSITDVYGLEQLISEPTRITPASSTLTDLSIPTLLIRLLVWEFVISGRVIIA